MDYTFFFILYGVLNMNNIKKFLSTFADSVHVASIGIDSVVVWLRNEFNNGAVKFSNNIVVDSFEELPAYRAEIQDIMRPLFVERKINAEMAKLKDAIILSDSSGNTKELESMLEQQFYSEIGAMKKYMDSNFSSSDTKALEKFISWVKGRLVWYLNADARNNKDKSKAIRAIKGWFASKVSKSMETLNTILGKKKKETSEETDLQKLQKKIKPVTNFLTSLQKNGAITFEQLAGAESSLNDLLKLVNKK